MKTLSLKQIISAQPTVRRETSVAFGLTIQDCSPIWIDLAVFSVGGLFDSVLSSCLILFISFFFICFFFAYSWQLDFAFKTNLYKRISALHISISTELSSSLYQKGHASTEILYISQASTQKREGIVNSSYTNCGRTFYIQFFDHF